LAIHFLVLEFLAQRKHACALVQKVLGIVGGTIAGQLVCQARDLRLSRAI
jgi:hypothetical protein